MRLCRRSQFMHTDGLIVVSPTVDILLTSPTGVLLEATCLTVIEWNQSFEGSRDMRKEDRLGWTPDRAAGIVLVQSQGTGASAETGEHDVYTRVRYWEQAGGMS